MAYDQKPPEGELDPEDYGFQEERQVTYQDEITGSVFERRVREQAHRYMVARFGQSYVFRAPETFDNVLERWLKVLADHGDLDFCDQLMSQIEQMTARSRK